ncbi:MAG: ABC transporter substrate-binding protein [Lachnospiraceae bacterium]|nr:ABC transporter substrate-binding protein [Lachnospiraceae bacterium]
MKRGFLKQILALTLAVALTGSFVGCSGKDPVVENASAVEGAVTETDADKANTFTYAISGDPGESTNVITSSSRWDLSTIKLIYSPLFMFNADGINWFLATDYETEDNLTYTFHLRDDVTWSDGEPFTADDVVFTYTEMEKEENLGWAYSQLVYEQGTVAIEKVDDYTVSFTFPFVTPTAVEMLSQIFIMPEHIYKDVEDYEHNEYNLNSVGTGPFQAVEYVPGSYVKFRRNESYFLGTPAIENLVFRIIENSDTAILALESGEVDAYQAIPSEVDKIDLEANNLETYSYSEGRVGYLMVNAKNVPDQKVRQAIFFALNKDDLNKASYLSEEFYLTPYTFLPPSSRFYSEEVEKYEQNVEQSKKLLEEAGVTDLTLKLGYSGSDTAQSAWALLIQQQLAEVGITVELDAADSTALSAQMHDSENDYDLYFGGYIMGIDPDTFSSLFESGAAYNYMYYDYPEIDELFAAGRAETDEAAREEIYKELQAKIQDVATFYPITSNNKILVVNKRIQGIEDATLVPVYTFEDTSYLKIEE